MGTQTNAVGQIIGDTGISWNADLKGFWSYAPRGYFIERIPTGQSGSLRSAECVEYDDRRWALFRKTHSATAKFGGSPFVRQVLIRGTIKQCMQAAEIYEIRRVV